MPPAAADPAGPDTGAADTGGSTPAVEAPAAPATPTAPASPAPDTSTPAAPAAPAGEPAADDVFGELADQAVFDRGYVEKIRREGQRYREQARELEGRLEPVGDIVDLLGSFDDGDRAGWRELMTQYRDDPVGAAERFRVVSDAILEQAGVDPSTATPQQQQAAQQAAAETMNSDEPLTAERVDQMVQERLAAERTQAQQAREVEQVFETIREAGIDPNGADGFAVLWRANNEYDGDIGKAIEAQKASRQKIIDEYLEGVRTGKRATPAPDGTPGTAPQEISTFDDARRATQQMHLAQRDAG